MSLRIRGMVMAGLLAGFGAVCAGSADAQEVPKDIQAPAGEQVLLQVHAKGDQVYVCKEDVSEYVWVLKAPEAPLFDEDAKPFGRHYAGPTWEANDGSRVKGKAVADAPAPEEGAIPWLLVRVVSHEGDGVLARAVSVQRINTKGGKAPATGCDSKHGGAEARVPYEADYVFWAPNNSGPPH
jgi:Protein of unknown function (DUF3455)